MGLFERQLWAGTKIDHILVGSDYKTGKVPLDAAVVYFKHRGDTNFLRLSFLTYFLAYLATNWNLSSMWVQVLFYYHHEPSTQNIIKHWKCLINICKTVLNPFAIIHRVYWFTCLFSSLNKHGKHFLSRASL